MILGPLLTLPASAMRTTARLLRLLADTGDVLAAVLNSADNGRRQRTRTDAAPSRTGSATVAAPTTPVADPVADPDIATLATRTAPQVIAALDSLSTEALADLYEHEGHNRRRRTVLQAIERATLPPAEVRAPEPLPTDDVRLPNELVYSTQTPVGS